MVNTPPEGATVTAVAVGRVVAAVGWVVACDGAVATGGLVTAGTFVAGAGVAPPQADKKSEKMVSSDIKTNIFFDIGAPCEKI
jgi:hypothetical protein